MKSFIHMFLSVFLIISSQASFADQKETKKLFSYWVRVPKTENSCDKEADILSGKFKQITKLTVTEEQCRGVIDTVMGGEKIQLYSIEVIYLATQAVNPYISIFGMSSYESTPNTTRGAYATYSSCIADLKNQGALFEKETEIPYLAGYCEPADLQDSFVMKIEGFGEPKRQLQVAHISPSVQPESRLAQEIFSFVSEMGADIVRVTYPHYFYYSKDRLTIRDSHFGYFKNKQNCEAQINSVRDMYATLKFNHNLVSCVVTPKSSILFGMTNGYLSTPFRSKTAYYSFAECMNDRERVARTYPTMTPIIGTICSENFDNRALFQMDIYTSR